MTVGTAVKADGSNGALKPTSFTSGGTSTELVSLEWANNNVVLTLNPHVSLSGHVLDFIDLNGNVALSLFADAATVDSAAGTYSWPVTTEPWEDGDQLMLRIREAGTEIFLTNLPSSMVQGASHWFTVNPTSLNRLRSYSYRLSADNADVASHNSACSSSPINITVPTGETSYARQHALLGCGVPGATVTATLLEGTTEVDTTTYSVTVTPPPPPSVAIESLASSIEEGESDSFVISASHLDTANGHTIRLTTDNANMGFDSGCADREEDLTVGRGSAAYVDSRRLYGCTAPGGTLTVTLLQGETVVSTTTYDVEVTPPPSPSVEFLNSPYTLESGGRVVVRMRASNLDTDSSYTIRVAPDNANLGYNQGYTSREFADGTSGRNSFSTFFTLYGCASPGGTLTATVLEGTTEVNTATQDVTVTSPASTDATLSALALSDVTLTFDFATTSYTADVVNSVAETTVTATANDDGATHVIKLGGVVDDDGAVALAVGANVITVEVTAEDGIATQTYTVTVTRADAPLTASFKEAPESHNGVDAFTLRIAFSEAISAGFATVRDHVLNVTGGDVTGARRVDGRSNLWEVTVQPDSTSDVVIVLPVTTDCTAQGAVCTSGDKPLSTSGVDRVWYGLM